MAEQDKPKRRKRTYPHGSGDRNVWSPFGKERMPVHEGGTQRVAPPAPAPRKPKPGER
ncbi:MAG: hypothetical protein KA124_10440 [Luteimonas sp.]|nr:hypothetical protein [Luteimonas sp.]